MQKQIKKKKPGSLEEEKIVHLVGNKPLTSLCGKYPCINKTADIEKTTCKECIKIVGN